MNVLLLSPDRVGSTLLQILLTIYMQDLFDSPVINIGEITRGITKKFNTHLNRSVLCKQRNMALWDINEPLPSIVKKIETAEHYVTGKLGQHFFLRNDSVSELDSFYKFLNKNFYIILCQRKDIFDQALSFSIRKTTGIRNLCSFNNNTINTKITINKEDFILGLNSYQKLINWAKSNFDINREFIYDNHINDLENFILQLEFIPESQSWKNMFNLDFNTYMSIHNNSVHGTSNKEEEMLLAQYQIIQTKISKLSNAKILTEDITVKLYPYDLKQNIVRNFKESQHWYNDWISNNVH